MTLARRRVPELMDDPGLDGAKHRAALRGLARLNSIAGVDAEIWKVMAPLARSNGGRLRILDVATGAGDMPIRLARRAAREGIDVELHGCDISDVALASAKEAAARAGIPFGTHQIDVLASPLPTGFDVAYCGLFLHHLDPPEVETVLRQMAAAAYSVVVQDLRRTRLGLMMAWAASRLFTRSYVVQVDAVRSVLAAFTLAEMEEMARRAGLADARVWPIWPERQLLSWQRSR